MVRTYEALTNSGDYSLIETEDGSYTIYSNYYQEACHSLIGAKLETNFQYVQGCKIQNLASNLKEFSILEVGFGLGLGLLETAKAVEASKAFVNFVSLEIDEILVLDFLKQEKIEFIKTDNTVSFNLTKKFFVKIIIGDARLRSEEIRNAVIWPLMAIYQDAFSPKKNVMLWTLEWFSFLAELIEPSGILSTYSAALRVRKTLQQAGFGIVEGGSLGQKRSSTRASKDSITDEILARRLSSDKILLLTDSLTDKSIPF